VSNPEVIRALRELLAKEEVTELCRQCRLAQQASAEEQNKNNEPSPDVESLRSDNESLSRQCEELHQELAVLQSSADSFHSDNAKLQVTVATLQSQVSSLSTQHTALQLANSQLVAEKDEVEMFLVSMTCFISRGTVTSTSHFISRECHIVNVVFECSSHNFCGSF
jgi:chromosome segregation ATPase